MTDTLRRFGLGALILAAAILPSLGQSVNDAIDDPIDCGTGEATAGLLPAVVDIISIDIRKQNDDLVATVEFRGDPSIGDSVSGGIVALDPGGLNPSSDSDWHFDNVGNVMFNYAGDALSTVERKFVVDSTGAWVADTTTSFTAARAGNVVIVRIPGQELGPGSVWMAYSSTSLFELVPRCDVVGNDGRGLPILEVPELVAVADVYQATGNVAISVPALAGVLENDIDAVSITDFDDASEGGGAVDIEADGGFAYSPAPGFGGEDRFSYTVTDGKGGVSTAEVTVAVGRALWFVDASVEPGPGTGTMSDRFIDLVSLGAVAGTPVGPKPADAILIFEGVYDAGLVLDSGQVVVGQSMDMLQVLQNEGFQIPLYSDLLDNPPALGDSPVFRSDSLDAVRLSQGNRIYGISVEDTRRGYAVRGDSVGMLLIKDVSVIGLGGILDVSRGEVDVTFSAATSDSASLDAMFIGDVVGSIVAESPVIITSPGRNGLAIQGGSPVMEFPMLTIVDADSGHAVAITGSQGQADLGFVDIRSTSGSGILAEGGMLTVHGGAIQTGDAALDLQTMALDVRFDSVASSGPKGMRLSEVSGSLVVDGRATIGSSSAPSLAIAGSSLRVEIGDLNIVKSDSSFGIHVSGSQGSVLRLERLVLLNARGGGMLVAGVDSVEIGAGSITTKEGPGLDLTDLAADVRLDSVSVDSASTAIRMMNSGGLIRIGEQPSIRGGVLSRITGHAIDIQNIERAALFGLGISGVGGSAVELQNFGDVRLTGLQIEGADSAAIRASTGGLLEVVGTTIADVRRGIEVSEVDLVSLRDNVITQTEGAAMDLSNAAAAGAGKSQAGDAEAVVVGNEIVTDSEDGIVISAREVGSFVLDLRENRTVSATSEYVLLAEEPAALLLQGFAGGDGEAAAAFIRKTNLGSPRVEVTGTIAAGPSGEADVVVVESLVSDPEPLPERVIEYTVRVTNVGPAPAIAVILVDSLSDELGYVPESIVVDGDGVTDEDDDDAADFGVTTENAVTVRLGDMSVTDTAVVSFQARPRQASAGSSVTNTVVVGALSPDPILTNNRSEAGIQVKLNTSIQDGDLPASFSLLPNYPNPFNPNTTISFDLPTPEHVRLTILNTLGQEIDVLIDDDMSPGRHTIRWNAGRTVTPAGSGLYLIRLEAGRYAAARSMILLK